MAEFYGSVQGNRGEATRLGSASSGIKTVAASWHGSVRTHLSVDEDGKTRAKVYLAPWHGAGVHKMLYDGPVNPGGDSEQGT